MIAKRIGRNDPCPCGSGLKYKKCCLNARFSKDPARSDAPHVPKEVLETVASHLKAEAERKKRFGEVRPIIHTDCHGYKIVAVGNEIHFEETSKWKTFPDFLFSYVWRVLGAEWAKAEFAKRPEDQHEIVKWHRQARRFQNEQPRNADGLYGALPTGSLGALLLLAYDLYVLRHHTALQEEVVRRLKNRDQFQGARYELQVAATFIRAAFDINYEDESDSSRKHPEFVATRKTTGEVVAVEAKTRHRRGVLGFQGDREPDERLKAGIGGLLSKAFSKPTAFPYAIFVDLNLPPVDGQLLDRQWVGEILQSLQDKRLPASPDPFNLIVFTNNPHHYVGSGTNMPRDIFALFSQRPRVATKHPDVFQVICKAAQQCGNIPTAFTAD
jgi:hypothetical protein